MKSEFLTEQTENLTEIFSSVLSLNLKAPLLVWASGFSIGAVTGFVDNWIFKPYTVYFVLMLLIACDHFAGVAVAWKGNNFRTDKFLRVFWTLLSHTGLLLFASSLSKGSVALFWLNEAVFVPLVLVNFISFVKNLSLLGYVSKTFASILYKKIDVHKNDLINKINQNEEPTDN
jgi:hypothetical protein